MKTRLSFVKFYLYTFLAFVLTAVILLFPADCLSFALKGLNLWFERMIPTLFPFMVLSGIIIRMDLTDSFVKILNPVLGRLFRIRPACVYGMLVGFLCGFPMGAHVTAQLYEQKQISRQEAAYLLSFCNNIGPVYFISFVLPMLSLKETAPFLFGMYGLPLLYGLFLRYTVFQNAVDGGFCQRLPAKKRIFLLTAMDESVLSALSGIARLGGYMVFFNLLYLLSFGNHRRNQSDGKPDAAPGSVHSSLWGPFLYCPDLQHDKKHGPFRHGICNAQNGAHRRYRFVLCAAVQLPARIASASCNLKTRLTFRSKPGTQISYL